MANSGEWKNMSVIEAIRLIKDQKMLLPIIQREYVWDRKDIISLFESIIDEFPVGSFVIWKTNEEVLRKTLDSWQNVEAIFVNKTKKCWILGLLQIQVIGLLQELLRIGKKIEEYGIK